MTKISLIRNDCSVENFTEYEMTILIENLTDRVTNLTVLKEMTLLLKN